MANVQLEQLEEAIKTVAMSAARVMSIESAAEMVNKDAKEIVDKLENLKHDLQEMGGEEAQQRPLSEPISEGYPPNKYRALAQKICGVLMNKHHLSIFCDFVGVINEIEKYFKELEEENLLVLSEYLIPQD
jgi:hypothetical protein